MITIRIALNTDIEEIQSLYRNTVLVINRRDYSQAARLKIGHRAEMILLK